MELALKIKMEHNSYLSIAKILVAEIAPGPVRDTLYRPLMMCIRQFFLLCHNVRHGRLTESVVEEFGVGRIECPCVGGKKHVGPVIRVRVLTTFLPSVTLVSVDCRRIFFRKENLLTIRWGR